MTPVLSLAALVPDYVASGRLMGNAGWMPAGLGEQGNLDSKLMQNWSCPRSLRVMTANVATLAQLGRISILEQTFTEAGVHMVGIQESRLQGNTETTGDHFMMYGSGATAEGCYGIQLWLSKQIRTTRVDIEPVSPRVLVALVWLECGLQLAVVVAHAPIEDSALVEKNQFWDTFEACLARLKSKAPKALQVVLADLNARVGSVKAACFGEHGAEIENENGALARSAFQNNHLNAVNTFFANAAGPTWYGRNQSKGHRIDYVAVARESAHLVTHAVRDESIDLATAIKTDHVAVWCDIAVVGDDRPLEATKPQSVGLPKFDPKSLNDPACVNKFRETLDKGQAKIDAKWAARPNGEIKSPMALDERVEEWTKLMQRAALSSFAPINQRRPKKHWISEMAWTAVRCVAPFRRQFVREHALQHRFAMRCVVHAWACMAQRSKGRESTVETLSEQVCDKTMSAFNFSRSRMFIRLCCLQAASRAAVRGDRAKLMENTAWEAQQAADRGDAASTYKHVRLLGGTPHKALDAVKDKQGNHITDSEDKAKRWVDHFSDVFGGMVVPTWKDSHATPNADETAVVVEIGRGTTTVTRDEVDKEIKDLPLNKGVGPDGLTAELLQSAGPVAANFLHAVANDMWHCGWFPVRWRGGILQRIWKRKGDPAVCDESRGILLADHSSKIFTGVLQKKVSQAYHDYIPEVQFGCAKGRGTQQASAHTMLFIDACRLLERSMAVLYVDLSKAFDFALREVLLGWMPGQRGDKVSHLRGLGLEDAQAREMADYINTTGGILTECGVDPATRSLIASLHSGAWFVVGRDGDMDTKPAIVTSRGGRQGCRLGAIVFNWIYAKCLKELRIELERAGVVLHLEGFPKAPPWAESSSAQPAAAPPPGDRGHDRPERVPVVEATYVDDEAVYLTASSPKALSIAIEILFRLLQDAFAKYAFKVNWKRGKTEMMLKMRGKNARRVYADLVCNHGGEEVILLPGGRGYVHLVDVYKHVGTTVTSDGGMMREVTKRCSDALACFCPLATKVFGCKQVSPCLRLALASSLVFSRLLYNAGVWPQLHQAAFRRLNATYMRVLRRVHGAVRANGGWKVKDGEVFQQLGASSLEDKLRQARLKTLAKFVRCAPPALRLLLQVKGRCGEPMSWIAAIRDDLQELARRLPEKLASLGDPVENAADWQTLIERYPAEWSSLVDLAFARPPVVADEPCVPKARAGAVNLEFVCRTCSAAFATGKARAQHERVKHKRRTYAEDFVGKEPVCPVCAKVFADRLRVVAHLSDTRVRAKHGRPSCTQLLLSGGYPKIQAEVLEAERSLNKAARTQARRQGHTRPVVGFGQHACAPKLSGASQLPRKRMREKTPPDEVEWIWLKSQRIA